MDVGADPEGFPQPPLQSVGIVLMVLTLPASLPPRPEPLDQLGQGPADVQHEEEAQEDAKVLNCAAAGDCVGWLLIDLTTETCSEK
jgi:hypothetical protein